MPPSYDKIKVEILKIKHRSEETGWTVLEVQELNLQNRIVTAVGVLIPLQPGDHCHFEGEWTSHHHFGPQFRIENVFFTLPASRSGMIRYLSAGGFPGIGKVTATKIVKYFKDELLDILEHDPQKVLQTPKVAKKKLQQFLEVWDERQSINRFLIFLYEHGLGGKKAENTVRHYTDRNISLTQIQQNPYRLIKDIRGIGFLTADKMAQSTGIPKNSPQRIAAGCMHILETEAEHEGHTYIEYSHLQERLLELLQISTKELHSHLQEVLRSLTQEELITQDAGRYQLQFLQEQEQLAACALQRVMTTPITTLSKETPQRIESWTHKFMEQAQISLSSQQQQAILQAATAKVFVLTGGPGVGKTTTVNTMIHLFRAMGKSVVLTAPTGRAAQRMAEVAQVPAKTIHRLLKWNPESHSFEHNEEKPLAEQVIIVDESSMLDVYLACHLFRAVRAAAQLILIGDQDQLPSVGPGAVLRDLLNCHQIPHVTLTEVFRQAESSAIVKSAHLMNRGQMPSFVSSGTDCRFIETDSNEQTLEVITKLVSETLPAVGYDPFTQIQLLTPMNRGYLGCDNLNTHIQQWLNPISSTDSTPTSSSRPNKAELRQGDKAIQTVNNYEKQVFNGDIGIVSEHNVRGSKLLVQFGARTTAYANDETKELSLAYAITIHKSQGSEFDVVILPLSMSHYVMLQRNLFYTGLTRAKKLAIFIGDKRALRQAIANQTSHQRRTTFLEQLSKGATS
ncbi:MAG: ATP-dependent RecD-like DNA helicase [Zetaproteobacteria bacterium]|nr:ATP-dependent RecD-like DNA helicase [Zetaproteobacteria bacterium]